MYGRLTLDVLMLSNVAGCSVLIRQDVGVGVWTHASVETGKVGVLHQMISCFGLTTPVWGIREEHRRCGSKYSEVRVCGYIKMARHGHEGISSDDSQWSARRYWSLCLSTFCYLFILLREGR